LVLNTAVAGEWRGTAKWLSIPDPLSGEAFIRCPDTQICEIDPFVDSLKAVPKSGLHNPLKKPER
jgi:1-pyrroline-5-carboxylate dehydrogenase